jgi:putative DNA primase/helicase
MKLIPTFDDLKTPTPILNHIEQLIKKSEATPHAEILQHLMEQFKLLDFEELANPHGAENFKLNAKHFLVLSIENTLLFAKKNRWGLCKNHDFIYLFLV